MFYPLLREFKGKQVYKNAPRRHAPGEVLIFGLDSVMKITLSIDRIRKRAFGNCMTVSELISIKVLMVPAKYKCKCEQDKFPTVTFSKQQAETNQFGEHGALKKHKYHQKQVFAPVFLTAVSSVVATATK